VVFSSGAGTGWLRLIFLVEVTEITDEGQRDAPRRGGGFFLLVRFLRLDVGFLLGAGRFLPGPGRARVAGCGVTPGQEGTRCPGSCPLAGCPPAGRFPAGCFLVGTVPRLVLLIPWRGTRPAGNARRPGAPPITGRGTVPPGVPGAGTGSGGPACPPVRRPAPQVAARRRGRGPGRRPRRVVRLALRAGRHFLVHPVPEVIVWRCREMRCGRRGGAVRRRGWGGGALLRLPGRPPVMRRLLLGDARVRLPGAGWGARLVGRTGRGARFLGRTGRGARFLGRTGRGARFLGRGCRPARRRRGWGEDPAAVRLAGVRLAGRPPGIRRLLPGNADVQPLRWPGSRGRAAGRAGGAAGRRGPSGPLVGTCSLARTGGTAVDRALACRLPGTATGRRLPGTATGRRLPGTATGRRLDGTAGRGACRWRDWRAAAGRRGRRSLPL
jgi:hypothetical protein